MNCRPGCRPAGGGRPLGQARRVLPPAATASKVATTLAVHSLQRKREVARKESALVDEPMLLVSERGCVLAGVLWASDAEMIGSGVLLCECTISRTRRLHSSTSMPGSRPYVCCGGQPAEATSVADAHFRTARRQNRRECQCVAPSHGHDV
jgi:hypothetical protein